MRNLLRYVLFIAVCSLWGTLFFIVPDFCDSSQNDLKSIISICGYVIALGIFQFLLLFVLFLNKYISAVIIPIYALVGATVSFYRIAYKITVTPIIIDVFLHTNAAEAASVVSWQLFIWLIINIWIAVLSILYRFKKVERISLWYLPLFIFLIIIYHNCNIRLYESINRRYPAVVLSSICQYFSLKQSVSDVRALPNIKQNNMLDSLDVIVVLGESMRSDHVNMNGYYRMTMPHLSNRRNCVSLPNIYSEYVTTEASLPHILTPADSVNTNLSGTSYSFISCFSVCGYYTSWLSNQDYGYSYSSFIKEADTIVFPNAGKTIYVYSPWYDGELLSSLEELMSCERSHNLYVFHTIGSHWYYNNHVPQALQKFQPTTNSRVISANTSEQMINSYDNTIVYTDCFLDTLIAKFEDKSAIMLFLSDHGECLGEEGKWLHAGSGAAIHRPAALVWYSDKYALQYPEKVDALMRNCYKHYRTDYFFYSVLSSAGIEASGNNEGFDIFWQDE